MATVNKDFKIKSGLVVEGTTATVNGYDILTKKPADDQYIIDLIGGETLVKSVEATQLEVNGAGKLSVKAEVFDAYGAAAEAESNANLFATGEADAAEAAANTYTDNRETAITTAYENYADQAELDAISTANAYTDTAEGREQTNRNNAIANAISDLNLPNTYDAKGAAAQALTDAQNYADAQVQDSQTTSTTTWSSYKTSTEIGLAEQDAKDYADTAIANLVDSAPSTLNTLNELAAALQDNPDIITDLQDIAAGKQDTLTAGANIDITGATISVTGLDSADISDFNTAALSATSAAYDVAGAAAEAYTDAVAAAALDATSKADAAEDAAIAAAALDATSKANAAEQNAKDYADALDTDDVAEGTAQYFTDVRAKQSSAALITGATKTNITITGDENGLIITAENGVADSNTDDLVEGETNLYFTDERVLGAIDGSNIDPQSIDITWVRREEATWTNVTTASTATVHSFGTNEGSVKYLVRVISGPNSHVTEVLATTDSNNNVAVVEYGTIYTSLDPLATVTVVWNAATSQYNLNVTTAQNSSEVLVAATLLAYND